MFRTESPRPSWSGLVWGALGYAEVLFWHVKSGDKKWRQAPQETNVTC